ncbi:ethanolamine ammonia-lyase subunit EutB [Flavobacteriaceae bacterium S356]|uniref:Ethanolamine ammonia-lyase subunit EutB n=1 Tax=Asprobacillus argus TaxID=3076534 RepID=A0ABU3LEG4_9FLAO|nr:ethanolamine ammonia-lyase subunit EutB [Flavobacteriaceae bacterium S356]
MQQINRKEFLTKLGLLSSSVVLLNGCRLWESNINSVNVPAGPILPPLDAEDIFSYIKRVHGKMDLTLYRQIIGAANEFKEGDEILGVAAYNEDSRKHARILLGNTQLKDIYTTTPFKDELQEFIQTNSAVDKHSYLLDWTVNDLKKFVLNSSEADIKQIMPGLTSDIIGCLVKVMTNDELITVGQKVFNPLPNSKIGSKGYLSARVQPNSPTDNTDDIMWQVFNAWSFGVGDLVLGTNPVSSEVSSVAAIEKTLFDIVSTFKLEKIIPNCVLSHIDVQSEVEEIQPGTTGIWFQSLAGTVHANKTFDVSIEKMLKYASQRKGQYGLYAETGQGADFTNGHGEGFDMVMHESRKYGFLRALKLRMIADNDHEPWVYVNDVAGFIGPEVFKTKDQLVRCCLEDTVMGKLHGLTIGLDICSTLHMDISLEDLDWCIDQIMPANPAYLMALPTKNDPMLSYLTTAFHNHIKIREKFGYKVNDAMWDFFKSIDIIGQNNKPTAHFGDPIWVYYQYLKAKKDPRSKEEIYAEGMVLIDEIEKRGVPIAQGYGKNIWDLEPALEKQVQALYEDAKVSLWTEMSTSFVKSIPAALPIITKSKDRKDYVYHPESGELLSNAAKRRLISLKNTWGTTIPDIQIVISDGLNARALMDKGHLSPYLQELEKLLLEKEYALSPRHIVITNGRVRAGYASGELLFGQKNKKTKSKGIVHIIGERPGSGHHNFSAYLTVATQDTWGIKGLIDHNITKVVSGISDTAFSPKEAAMNTIALLDEMFVMRIKTS